MYITINGRDYEGIRALSFAPEVDPAGMTLPISGFEADIHTSDEAEAGEYALLRDDLGRLWAKYYITRAVRVDADILRIRAESPLSLIARDVLPATYYNAAPIADVLVDVFRNTGAGWGRTSIDWIRRFPGRSSRGSCRGRAPGSGYCGRASPSGRRSGAALTRTSGSCRRTRGTR